MLYGAFRGKEEWSERYEAIDTQGSVVGEDKSILSCFLHEYFELPFRKV